MTSGSEEYQKSASRRDFDSLLLESVNEAVSIVLGQRITPELNHHLEAYLGLSVEELLGNVERLFSLLEFSFGLSGSAVPKLIVKKMYQKAKVPFYEVAGTPMIQYVYELKRKLASHSLLATAKTPSFNMGSQVLQPYQTPCSSTERR